MALLVMLAMLHDGGGEGDSDMMTCWLAALCQREEPSRQDKIVGLFKRPLQ